MLESDQEYFYNGIKDAIISGLEYGWFKPEIAGRIARFYGLTRESILIFDQLELGAFDTRSADEIDSIMGVESIYGDDEEV